MTDQLRARTAGDLRPRAYELDHGHTAPEGSSGELKQSPAVQRSP